MNDKQKAFLSELYMLCRKYSIKSIEIDKYDCDRIKFVSNGESLSFGSMRIEKESGQFIAITTKQSDFLPELREEESE